MGRRGADWTRGAGAAGGQACGGREGRPGPPAPSSRRPGAARGEGRGRVWGLGLEPDLALSVPACVGSPAFPGGSGICGWPVRVPGCWVPPLDLGGYLCPPCHRFSPKQGKVSGAGCRGLAQGCWLPGERLPGPAGTSV